MKEPNKSMINYTLPLIVPYSNRVIPGGCGRGVCRRRLEAMVCCRHALLLWVSAAFFCARWLGRGALPCSGLLCAHLPVAVGAGLLNRLYLGLFLRLQTLVACREAVDRDAQYVLPLLQVCVLRVEQGGAVVFHQTFHQGELLCLRERYLVELQLALRGRDVYGIGDSRGVEVHGQLVVAYNLGSHGGVAVLLTRAGARDAARAYGYGRCQGSANKYGFPHGLRI